MPDDEQSMMKQIWNGVGVLARGGYFASSSCSRISLWQGVAGSYAKWSKHTGTSAGGMSAGVSGKVFRRWTPARLKTANGNKNISPQCETRKEFQGASPSRLEGESVPEPRLRLGGHEKSLLWLPSGSRAERAGGWNDCYSIIIYSSLFLDIFFYSSFSSTHRLIQRVKSVS